MAIRKSSSSGTPFGDTSGRPASASVGQTYYNGQLGYLEIYTVSGWIPATGANDFSLNITGLNTAVTFTQTYSSGSYSIVSFLNDATVDVYAYSDDGSLAGYSNTKAFTATQRFNKMVILGGSAGDVLQFSYKTTYATATSTTDVTAGPYITSITPSGVPNQNDTITIAGGNFASDVAVTFTGTGYSATAAKSVVRSSSTSLLVTRPDSLPPSGSPYTVTISNPGVTSPTGSSVHQYSPITSGVVPVWQTSTSLAASSYGSAYSASVSATDSDGSSSISYSIVSGSLPTGITFSAGTFSGTPTSSTEGTYSYTIRATDSGGNYADRTFTTSYVSLSGGTLTSDSTYYYRTFTGTGTFVCGKAITADILILGGGGPGGGNLAGGGGAGGYKYYSSYSVPLASHVITIGAGGARATGSQTGGRGLNGTDTSFGSVWTSIGGGAGGSGEPGTEINGLNGGSGGGSTGYTASVTRSSGTSGQGYAGGISGRGGPNYPGAGGGGSSGQGEDVPSSSSRAGDGGAGTLNTILGPSYYWAAGGGGGIYVSGSTRAGNGGIGGGGGGGSNGTVAGTAGGSAYNPGSNGVAVNNGGQGSGNTGGDAGVNTGSGGGGACHNASTGGAGGSGIVIIRYTKASVGG